MTYEIIFPIHYFYICIHVLQVQYLTRIKKLIQPLKRNMWLPEVCLLPVLILELHH